MGKVLRVYLNTNKELCYNTCKLDTFKLIYKRNISNNSNVTYSQNNNSRETNVHALTSNTYKVKRKQLTNKIHIIKINPVAYLQHKHMRIA